MFPAATVLFTLVGQAAKIICVTLTRRNCHLRGNWIVIIVVLVAVVAVVVVIVVIMQKKPTTDNDVNWEIRTSHQQVVSKPYRGRRT